MSIRKREKELEASEFKNQLEKSANYHSVIEWQKHCNRMENKVIVEKQMFNEKMKREVEAKQRKEFVRTNFGPEETVITQQIFRQKKIDHQSILKDELTTQIKVNMILTCIQIKQQHKDNLKLQERAEELESLANAVKILEIENKEIMDKKFTHQ